MFRKCLGLGYDYNIEKADKIDTSPLIFRRHGKESKPMVGRRN